MEKFTGNFPRIQLERGFPLELNHRDWLISINDPDGMNSSPPNIKDKFDRVFPFFFEDNCPPEKGAMTVDQAGEMTRVILDARQQDKNLWVHCTAGVCRSGAVVELLNLLGWTIVDDWSPRRLPNTHVFSLLRQQFPELAQSWDAKIEEMGYKFYYDWIKSLEDSKDI